jgi:predicted O-methyltransferase YrrM
MEAEDKMTPPFSTKAYKDSDHRRFWWWRIGDVDHDPLVYHLMDQHQRDLFAEWYRDTEAKNFIGECTPPLASVLMGFISGNAVKRVVQLGHYAGYSSINLGLVLKKITGGKLATIDISDRMSKYTQEWMDRFEFSDHVKVITADSASAEAADQAEAFIGGEPEIVLIDSSHKYEHTLKELDLWIGRLKKNGFIFLHDASNAAREYDPEKGAVAGALEKWCADNEYKYFVFNGGDATPGSTHAQLVHRDGRGLAVIQKCK